MEYVYHIGNFYACIFGRYDGTHLTRYSVTVRRLCAVHVGTGPYSVCTAPILACPGSLRSSLNTNS
jgi:hypothetical protein